MYSAVYKCVCKHQAERLYADLIRHVEVILTNWTMDLVKLRQSNDKMSFVLQAHHVLTQFFTALSSIGPIFTYLVRLK